MEKTFVLMIACLIVGTIFGYGIYYLVYEPQVNSLESEVNTLHQQIKGLYSDYLPFKILSNSMSPTINWGEMVLVKPMTNMSEINVDMLGTGDIIAFHRPNIPEEIIIHRAVDKWQDGDVWKLRTRGDNNPAVDNWIVSETDVIGIVTTIC